MLHYVKNFVIKSENFTVQNRNCGEYSKSVSDTLVLAKLQKCYTIFIQHRNSYAPEKAAKGQKQFFRKQLLTGNFLRISLFVNSLRNFFFLLPKIDNNRQK